MFRKRKGPGEGQGFNRISRLIEDRQRELDDDAPLDEPDEDTILMRPGTTISGATAAGAGAGMDGDDEDEVSLLSLRGRGAVVDEDGGADATPEQRPAATDQAGQDATTQIGSYGSSALADYERRPQAPRYEAPAPVAAPPMAVPDLGGARTGASLVAVEATWEGTLHSEGDIRVEGVLRGEIETSGTLVVAPHARVHGTVRARNVMIGGDLEGEVTCEERLEILPGGSARGQINSGTLVVHEGAYIDSRFQMRRETSAAGS